MEFDLTIQPIRSWDAEGQAAFCKVAEEYGEHSNMNRHYPYDDRGLHWRGTEAQYQAMRFPHLPDHQEAIRNAPFMMGAKKVAYERKSETRPDWQEVKVHAMAYVLTRKLGAHDYAERLAATGTRDIIEISMRDAFWGAQPRNGKYVGRNMLGILLMQLRAGARILELPPGTFFPEAPIRPLEDAQLGFGGLDQPTRRFAR
ncbi:NADAR family protein [Erythrobacter aureus]|uniref:DUF1768 domain-containing protein n=1 Tax=Erythrobacter aureus TaxID=2182384 RepID=A0A345YJ05_9SPHN|nr:NADAR family protein [Erythrobacter aureus]AXK43907.1 DUF1768 domain-containing protein [Erythrobacter aureus]